MSEFNLSNYLVANKPDGGVYPMIPRITCKDGFSMSVQCNSFNYCAPRVDHSDVYWKVEVGFPSTKPKFFAHKAEGVCRSDTDFTGAVYPYVEIELVEQEIKFHGGICS